MSPFVVFSLPRSRSAWLSVYLSRGGAAVGHDIGSECAAPADFFAKLGDGTCETGAAFAWRLIRQQLPDARFVVVRRNVAEVDTALRRFGLEGYLPELERRDGFLAEIAAQPGTLSVPYAALPLFDACADIFEHCRGQKADLAWWERLDRLNIQVDMPRQIARLRANHARLEELKLAVAEQVTHA